MIGLLGGACGRGSISSCSEGWSSVETSAASLTGGIPVRCDLFLLNWPVGVCTKYAVTHLLIHTPLYHPPMVFLDKSCVGDCDIGC